MYKKKKFFITFVLLICSATVAKAQTYYLNESLTTQSSFDKFTAISVKGNQVWHFEPQNPQYGACMNGYAYGVSYENEDWLISPAINLHNVSNLKLTFDHTRGPESEMNVGMAEGWYKVYATANYTGNVSTTQWIEITGVKHATIKWVFVNSGELAIPETVKSSNTRIAFKYLCSNSQSAMWEVKNVSVSGTPTQEVDFKITTWNVDWFSCPTLGPIDDDLQMNNIVSVIKAMNSDIVALQEVGTSNSYKTIEILAQQLGSEWAGSITAWDNDNCSQNQGIVYKKSKIQLVNSSLITNGGSSYNWSNGRYPALYNVNLTVGNQQVPITFVNIHAKAQADEESYARRKNASIGLKNLLDGNAYNTKKVIVIGDFNDYLSGTQCVSCGGQSPYKNFMDDAVNYKGLTTTVTHPYYDTPTVDHIVISNELFDNYLSNNVSVELAATQNIPNYYTTTSSHYPVSVTFRIKETVNIVDLPVSSSYQVYPNPATTELHINLATQETADYLIFNLPGQVVMQGKLQESSTINIESLSSGMYLLKISGTAVRFVKM